ncbi:WXG100 family type VII secretion target [Saccharomonospora glauca]|uniref:Putative T7SS secretion signal domain-containing protein n=1 Tax=Saccharomonospora glauca K62 TaxID=928724 RepID=I1D2M0_9PSEU|nr:hypothetical protein [Saccharomonospora glauca]EIE99194.1 hypothetical protein SacglDRAFT_02299 [Saccharomonospora glauca K62]
MSIDTKIEGDPETIRTAARWLRNTLAEAVHDCTTQIYAARTDTEADWTGPAGDAFREKMTNGGKKADGIADDARSAADHFDRFADDLHTAQTRMERARAIARDGGVTVQGTQIIDPGPGPDAPGDLPDDATPEQRAQHADAVTAHQQHARKLAAYREAATEASSAREEFNLKESITKNLLYEVQKKPPFHASFVADGLFAGYAANRAAAKALTAKWARMGAARQLSNVTGITHRGLPHSDTGRALKAAERARGAAANARTWSRTARAVGGKIPVLGLGITAASTAYDIAAGDTPAGKAIVVNGGSLAASIAAGAAVGSVVPVGGTVVGAIVGTGVGLVASGALGTAWDAAANTEIGKAVTDGINKGASAIGNGLKKAWNSIF